MDYEGVFLRDTGSRPQGEEIAAAASRDTYSVRKLIPTLLNAR